MQSSPVVGGLSWTAHSHQQQHVFGFYSFYSILILKFKKYGVFVYVFDNLGTKRCLNVLELKVSWLKIC